MMGLVAIIGASCLAVVEPLIAKGIVDVALSQSNARAFVVLLSFLLALLSLVFGMEWIGSYFLILCRERMRIVLRTETLFKSLASGSTQGEFYSFANSDRRSEFLSLTVARSLAAFFQILLILGILLAMRSSIFVGVFAAILLVVPMASRSSRKLTHLTDLQVRRNGRMLKRLKEVLEMGREIGPQRLAFMGNRIFTSDQNALVRVELSQFFWQNWFQGGHTLWTIALSLGSAIVSGFSVFRGELSVGEYIAIQVYIARIDQPTRTLIAFAKELRSTLRPVQEVQPLPSGERKSHQLDLSPGNRVLILGSPTEPWLELKASLRTRDLSSLESAKTSDTIFIVPDPGSFSGCIEESLVLNQSVKSPEETRRILKLLEIPSEFFLTPSLCQTQPGLLHRIQVARALILSPGVVVVEDFSSHLSEKDERLCVEALERFQGAIVFLGVQGALLRLAETVHSYVDGQLGEGKSIEEFIESGNGDRLLNFGPLEEAISSQKCAHLVEALAQKQGDKLPSLKLEFFGNSTTVVNALPDLIADLRVALRNDILVLWIGRFKLKCICSTLSETTRNPRQLSKAVVGAVSSSILERNLREVYFQFDEDRET